MALNLITDAWIPVLRRGRCTTIRPDEIAVEGIERVAWPRDDLNLACLELLVGLIYLAYPPRDDAAWRNRYDAPGAARLRDALDSFSPFFELTGEGPRFLQDLEQFEGARESNVSPPDMLFIDSAGVNTAKKNADIMVRRGRYARLPLPLAAMSLYTLQAFAPNGGRGNRASMRGGGPMVTLIKPVQGGAHPLWRQVWCNVPQGERLVPENAPRALPWLRPTKTSENDEKLTPHMSHGAEAFFGMPRRLRLLIDRDRVVGVAQRPHGTRYEHWVHPLTPYYRVKAGAALRPKHARPGRVRYQDWLGLAFGRCDDLRLLARAVHRYHALVDAPRAEVLAGGWAMKNMRPLEFGLHTYPTFRLDQDMEIRAETLIEAAVAVAKKLVASLNDAVALKGAARDAVWETFFRHTEQEFVRAIRCIADGSGQDVEASWLKALRSTALAIFDRNALTALATRDLAKIEATVTARRALDAFLGTSKGARRRLFLTDVA